MGGYGKQPATRIEKEDQSRYTCSTRNCPEPAEVWLPANETIHMADRELRHERGEYYGTSPARYNYRDEKMRLCYKCVRNLATQLFPGHRLPGARLWYPELPARTAAAPEEIAGTPEYRKYRDEHPTMPDPQPLVTINPTGVFTAQQVDGILAAMEATHAPVAKQSKPRRKTAKVAS